MQLLLWLSFPNDSGPVYKETLAGRFPVEPFNTASNFFFLAIIIYFAVRVYQKPKEQLFLAWVLPILFIGFIGGTVYHATRSHEVWLVMDWLPIVLLCLATAIYFVFQAGQNTVQKISLLTLVLGLSFGVRLIDWPRGWGISIGYIATALALLSPIFWHLYQHQMKRVHYVLAAIGSFALAISFRISDEHIDFLPMGSHWLWHSFGALAVFLLMQYIYKANLTSQSR